MPEAPDALSPDDEGRVAGAAGDIATAGTEATTLPAGEESTRDARGAVTEPADETAGRAEVALTQALDERPSPSAEIIELCDRIRKAIREKRPPDEDSLVNANPEAMAKAAGHELQTDVKGDAERVQGEYAGLDEAPAGQPTQTPAAYETPEAAVAADGGDATQAAPEPMPEDDFSLDADVSAQTQAIEDAGMQTEPAQLVEDGPIGAARDAHGDLEDAATETPAELNARQAEAITTAQTDMAALQAQALAALQASRAQTVGSTGGRQGQMVGSEEQQRAQAGQKMRQIFTGAKSQVSALLEPLSTNAMAKWDAGVATYASQFKASLAKVDRLVEERHSGFGGSIVAAWDGLTGLPDEIVSIYDRAEKSFGDDVCALIMKISEEVNGVIAACEAIIKNAREQIDGVVESLPDDLQAWAQGEATALNAELDTLQSDVQQTQQDFTRDLCDRAAGAVQEVREEVHSRREAAKGILGRIADAIAEFLDDPFRAIVNGLLSLAGIDSGAFWGLVDKLGDVVQAIADDPIGFCKTFIGAVGDGFKQFADNIVTHLGNGFFEWITGGLSSVGVQMPPDFSLGSIVTLCLQVMGLTWDRIKQVLGKHIGEENVELLDKAVEFIGTFMQQGPAGLFEMLKDHFDPSQLVGMVKDAAMQWLIETVVQKAVVKLVSMLNPAGAIVQAVIAVYDAITWLFDNAAKIFKVVEAVVNGAADLIAGNTAALAGKVELALAGMLAPAIDFVAELIGLGDLPDKIAGIIRDLQDWVLGVVDTAIGWVVKHVRGLLSKLGGGGEEQDAHEDASSDEVKHRRMADAADKTLSAVPDATDREKAVREKRAQADQLEQHYTPQLDGDVSMTITFPHEASATDELAFHILIAPNNTEKDGKTDLPGRIEQLFEQAGIDVSLIPVFGLDDPSKIGNADDIAAEAIQKAAAVHGAGIQMQKADRAFRNLITSAEGLAIMDIMLSRKLEGSEGYQTHILDALAAHSRKETIVAEMRDGLRLLERGPIVFNPKAGGDVDVALKSEAEDSGDSEGDDAPALEHATQTKRSTRKKAGRRIQEAVKTLMKVENAKSREVSLHLTDCSVEQFTDEDREGLALSLETHISNHGGQPGCISLRVQFNDGSSTEIS